MSNYVIEAENLTKTYHVGTEDVHALAGVDLTIRQGEFIAIMGASGSGKSTLMNILGCLDRPSAGVYRLEGRDVTQLDEAQIAQIRSRRIGFVFQSFNLLSRTSAQENVALPLFYTGHDHDSAVLARRALAAMGLSGREGNHPNQLSGGQQQRVAISRALINQPAILFADEPTGNLDSKTASEIMVTLRRLNREQGLTVILVTHEPDMATYADRVLTMRDGQVISDEQRQANTAATPPQAAGAAAVPAADSSVSMSFARMALLVAARAIARNKLRSALTMLGIFVGVAALITMVAIGQGANAAVAQQIESLGTNLLIVLPGAAVGGGARGGFGSASTLTVADADAVKRDAKAVADVSYLISQQAQAQYSDKNWATSVQGVSPSYFSIRNWRVVAGRSLSTDDEANAARTCLLGQTAYQNLFPAAQNPIGTTVLVKSVPLRVVGLLQARGQSGFGRDQDDVIFIPFTTAQTKVLGVAAPTQNTTSIDPVYSAAPNPFGITPRLIGYVNTIFVQAKSTALVPAAMQQINAILTQRHHAHSSTSTDFSVRNISDVTQAMEGSSRTMAALLAAVAAISLLVGGIGIMNILLVSVTERTREIGIRMAVGARRIHVLLQFLVEAVLLSAIGGALGIVAGVSCSELVSLIAAWPITLSFPAIVGGFAFSAVVGVFFGFYPARRAAHLNPIEALRYE